MEARPKPILGDPDRKKICTSDVERQNLTKRMQIRRLTSLTNAFSKRLGNHIAAISLHFMFYNFVRIHQSLRITPTMAAGVTNRVWDIADFVRMVEERKRGTCGNLARSETSGPTTRLAPHSARDSDSRTTTLIGLISSIYKSGTTIGILQTSNVVSRLGRYEKYGSGCPIVGIQTRLRVRQGAIGIRGYR